MILVTGANDLLRVVTTAAGAIAVHASWVDNSAGTITPGRTNTASITTATTTTVVAAPGANVFRAVKFLSIRNTHAATVNDITVLHTDGTNPEDVWEGFLAPNESVMFVDGEGWNRFTSGGVKQDAAGAGSPDVQTFAVGGTWTKPTSFTPKIVVVELTGPGGGGGGGASLATAVVAKGGGGGGGGCWLRATFAASDLPATVAVGLGTGGAGGTVGVGGAAGLSGGGGTDATFGTFLTAFGGGGGRLGAISALATGGGGGGGVGGAGQVGTTSGGAGGLPTAATNGTGGQGVTGSAAVATTANGEAGGGGGAGTAATPVAGSLGGSSIRAGGGGGAGACHSVTPSTVQGGAGGRSNSYAAGGGGAAGTDGWFEIGECCWRSFRQGIECFFLGIRRDVFEGLGAGLLIEVIKYGRHML